MRKLDPETVITLYIEQHLTLEQIAKRYHCTRPNVYYCLKKQGVTREQGTWIHLACDFCGDDIKRTRYRCKKTRSKQNFCDVRCHGHATRLHSSFQWQHGQRVARENISYVFDLKPEQIVHHKDGNHWNNDLENLVVFASQREHMRCHKGLVCCSLWDGDPNIPPLL